MSNLANIGDSAFYYLCRLCSLKCAIPGLSIFSEEGIMRDIKKKIQDCLHFSVEDGDKFPKTICRECAYKLDVSHEFLLKSLESQQFLSDLVNHEVFDTIYVIKNELQIPELCLDTTTIQDFEHLVDEAHLHADSSDITQIIQYHDGDINDDEIQNINHLDSSLAKADADSLPDIALYSFDSMSSNIKDVDFMPQANFHDENEPADDIEPIVDAVVETLETLGDNIPPPVTMALPESQQQQQQQQQPVQMVTPVAKEKRNPTKSGNNSKSCTICNKQFATNYKVTEHMRSHSTDSPFKCSHAGCSKAFRSKIGLTQHEATHTGEYRFACEVCGKGFQVKSYLTIHMKVHSQVKSFKCSICGDYMKSKQALIDHENRHLGVKAYPCSQCDQRFISRALCVTHEKTHFDVSTSRFKYPCTVCNKLFVRRAYLKTHMTIHSGDKPFVCDICGNKFLTNIDLKLHVKSHTGEKNLICEICGKAFIRPESLTIHNRSHSGERPYKCEFCDQQFSQKNTLKIHVRLHTGEKPYTCMLCPKRFLSRRYLKTHMNKHPPPIESMAIMGGIVEEVTPIIMDNNIQNQHHHLQQQQHHEDFFIDSTC